MSWENLKEKLNGLSTSDYYKAKEDGFEDVADIAEKLLYTEKYCKDFLNKAYKQGLVDKRLVRNSDNRRVVLFKML